MTITVHTPGDWTLNGDQLFSVHTDEDGDHETLIADIFTEHDWWKANARLLRAAPKLLCAAQKALSALQSNYDKYDKGEWHDADNRDAYIALRDAVSRAKGGRK